jgi:hypothetical protein
MFRRSGYRFADKNMRHSITARARPDSEGTGCAPAPIVMRAQVMVRHLGTWERQPISFRTLARRWNGVFAALAQICVRLLWWRRRLSAGSGRRLDLSHGPSAARATRFIAGIFHERSRRLRVSAMQVALQARSRARGAGTPGAPDPLPSLQGAARGDGGGVRSEVFSRREAKKNAALTRASRLHRQQGQASLQNAKDQQRAPSQEDEAQSKRAEQHEIFPGLLHRSWRVGNRQTLPQSRNQPIEKPGKPERKAL